MTSTGKVGPRCPVSLAYCVSSTWDKQWHRVSLYRKRLVKAVLTVMEDLRHRDGLVFGREIPGQQFFDSIDWVVGDAGQNVTQIGFRI
jgi:hypothetical protein